MKSIINRLGILAIAGASFLPSTALAYDGVITGTLKYVHIKGNTAPDSLMLELTSGVNLCGSGSGRAQTYAATNQPAFQAMVSTANAAFLAGRSVVLYSDWDASTSICVLKQIRMQ